MKKNPAIKEDNKARQFASVQMVVINNTSSGTSLWVPEETSETDELTVTENGVYCAYDDNVFGYLQVVVNVSESLNDRSEKDKAISKITGTNPDTGDTESYGVDEDGNLTKEVYPSGLPQAIHIVIEPTKKIYTSGETLDFSGIHVYLLDGEGHQWTSDEYPTGEIPFEELIFPVTVAYGEYSRETTSDLNISPMTSVVEGGSIYITDEIGGEDHMESVHIYASHYFIYSMQGRNSFGIIIASESPEDTYNISYVIHYRDREETTTYSGKFGDTSSYTHDGKTVYYTSHGMSSSNDRIIYAFGGFIFNINDQVRSNTIAWTMVYGTETHSGTQEEIPVQWIRSDEQTLEDTFNITVTGGNQSGNEGGGSSSGGEHTGGDF